MRTSRLASISQLDRHNNMVDMKEKLVIIGNGMVTGRFLDELLKYPNNNFHLTVVSAEPHGSYNRIMLSSVLAGEAQIPSIIQKSPQWYTENNIDLLQGEAATHINSAEKQIVTDRGKSIQYDHLIVATGSRSATIPANNQALDYIFPFRSIEHAEQMLSKAKHAKHALVVGGGFLGIEAAWGLLRQGLKVTVVHRGKHLLNRQLDSTAGKMLQRNLESMGMEFQLATEVDQFVGDTEVEAAVLKDGALLPCDMVVIATGITPNAELGWQAGLDGNKAILVDHYMRTCDPHISAMGECVEIGGQTFGLVDPLWQHAKVLASRLCESDRSAWICYQTKPIATKLKISGIQLYSAGIVTTDDTMQAITVYDEKANIYRKLNIQENKIIGIVLYGDVRSGNWYVELMEAKQQISSYLPMIILGKEQIAA